MDDVIIDRLRGSLMGLAVGDAMGVPLEFKSPGTFTPVTDMVGGGIFHLKPGEWTDDTSTALCLADSLIKKGGFDPVDQLKRYLCWYQEGYLSVNGVCFDIGNTTKEALELFIETGDPYCGPDHERSAGNGSLMRITPIPLFYNSIPGLAIKLAGDSSRTTHQHPLAIDACRYFTGLIIGALNDHCKDEILSKRFSTLSNYWNDNFLTRQIDEIACGSFKEKEPPLIKGSGFVVETLEAALWAFYNTDNFRDGCLKVVNLGDDSDTTGAVYGQLAGAYYGEEGIPQKWLHKLAKYDLISAMADRLGEVSKSVQG